MSTCIKSFSYFLSSLILEWHHNSRHVDVSTSTTSTRLVLSFVDKVETGLRFELCRRHLALC